MNFSLFSNKKPQKAEPKTVEPPECEHDWECVEASFEYYIANGCGNESFYHLSEWEAFVPFDFYNCENRVCLICGKCDNQIERAKKYIRAKKIKDRRRKALAKQLWEDGCKNEKSV